MSTEKSRRAPTRGGIDLVPILAGYRRRIDGCGSGHLHLGRYARNSFAARMDYFLDIATALPAA